MKEGYEPSATQPPSFREEIPEELLRSWNTNNFSIETYGETYSVIMLGEGHHDSGAPGAQAKQVELIELIKPEYVLYESLKGLIYDPKAREFRKQANRRFNLDDLDTHDNKPDKPIMEAADKIGFTIVGCDITSEELKVIEKTITRENPLEYRYNYKLERVVKLDDPDFQATIHSEIVVPFRDKQMVETMLHYLGETTKPIISIIGATHGANIHAKKLLQDKNFGYAFVDQGLKS